MTQEEKQLLLKDLCARLPYSLQIHIITVFQEVEFDNTLRYNHLEAFTCYRIEIKPYLRPMSSMTEEEKIRLVDMEFEIARLKIITYAHECMVLDYLYSRHLDVRGLIPMGLALEAPEGMYKTE